MILVVTEQRDLTADLVIAELRREGVDHIRLNTDRLLSDVALSFRAPENEFLFTEESGRQHSLSNVKSIWYRKPLPPVPDESLAPEYRRFVARESWSQALGTLFALPVFWMDRPDLIFRAGHKAFQLALASQLGIPVPRTLISRDPRDVRSFIEACPGHVVAKPVSHGSIDEAELAIYTSRLPSPIEDEVLRSLTSAPVVFQEEIPKRADVRLTLVGNDAFAVAINSQTNEETKVDWRRHVAKPLEHRLITLPEELLSKLFRLKMAFGLSFAAIDLVEKPDGNFVFLELNPNGQWGWIELQTGAPLAKAIVKTLISSPSRER